MAGLRLISVTSTDHLTNSENILGRRPGNFPGLFRIPSTEFQEHWNLKTASTHKQELNRQLHHLINEIGLRLYSKSNYDKDRN